MALPDFYDFTDPVSNLAATPYEAWDGTDIGEGNNCAPMMTLSGLADDRLILPPFLEENRIEFGARWALPLLIGAGSWFYSRRVAKAGLWALAAYMAPLPVAGVVAGMIGTGAMMAERTQNLGEGGEGYGVRQEGPRRRARRRCCAKYGYRNGKRRCIKTRPC